MPGLFKTDDSDHWGEGKVHVWIGGSNGALLCQPNSPPPWSGEMDPPDHQDVTCKRCIAAIKRGRMD